MGNSVMKNLDSNSLELAHLRVPDASVDYARMLIEATCEIFQTMVLMPLEVCQQESQRPDVLIDSVSAVVGLSGGVRGVVAVHCPDKVALGVFGAMLGEDPDQVDDEVRDTVGELGNMVAGGMKSRLSEMACEVALSVPSIASGKAYEVNLLSKADRLVQPFTTTFGTFLVEFKYTRP